MSREAGTAGDRLLKAIKDRLVAQGAKVDEEILRQRARGRAVTDQPPTGD